MNGRSLSWFEVLNGGGFATSTRSRLVEEGPNLDLLLRSRCGPEDLEGDGVCRSHVANAVTNAHDHISTNSLQSKQVGSGVLREMTWK